MATETLEIERKYDVEGDLPLPSLDGAVDGIVCGEATEQLLTATYLDTDDLRLRAGHVTLRHRTGDAQDGWHLKLPRGGARIEVRSTAPGPPAPPPSELQSLVRALVRRQDLAPVAELRTRRTVHPLLNDQGRVLLELSDDRVEGRRIGGQSLAWREWEAELVAGDTALLEAVERKLLEAGAARSGSGSKLRRLLDGTPGARGSAGVPRRLRKKATGADVVSAHLAEQVVELIARDPQVRRNEPAAVHKMRVATRRLRSALRTFRPLLDREHTDPLRDELRWLAGVLGAARDAEVLHARISELLDEQPAELVLGPVHKKVDDTLSSRYRKAHDRLVEELDGERYLALLDRLDALGTAPPWRERAHTPATDVLPGLIRHSDKRLGRAVETAEQTDGDAHDHALHEVRKLAKRLRYACEAVSPVFDKQATRLAYAATDLQEVLGDHQDSVVTRETLRELGAASSRSGENGFTFGRLHGIEQARAEQRGEQWREVWARTSRRKLRRWLDE